MFLKKNVVKRYPVLHLNDLTTIPVPEKAVWVYDSGVGGLSFIPRVQQLFDGELIYFADSDFVPYGDKTPEQVRERIVWCLQRIEKYKPFIVIVACHTVSTALMTIDGGVFVPFPVVCIHYATALSEQIKNGAQSIGIIATTRTIESNFYQNFLTQNFPDVKIHSQACPELVPLIESSTIGTPRLLEAIHEYIDPLVSVGIDTLFIGCTHYEFIKREIKQICGPKIKLVAAESTALIVVDGKQLRPYMPHRKARKSRLEDPLFVTTGYVKQFQFQMWELLPRSFYSHNTELVALKKINSVIP